MDATDILRSLPGVRPQGLQGGVEITALKIDPFRLGAALLATAQAQGAVLLNHMTVKGVQRGESGGITALETEDLVSHETFRVKCRMIFNATEERTDEVRTRLCPHAAPVTRIVKETRISVADDLMEGASSAIFLDRTEGSKSVFCTVPCGGMVRIGVEREDTEAGTGEEALLQKARRFMLFAPTAAQIRARSLCRRALFKPLGVAKTKKTGLLFEFRNVITVVGCDWISYRRVAEEALSEAAEQGLVYKRPCPTAFMSLRGGKEASLAGEIVTEVMRGAADPEKLDAFVRYCVQKEYAVSPEDIVRGRLGLFELDEAKAAALVGELQSHELFGK
jgi:glycerol-3-phosphate dehydrogenase